MAQKSIVFRGISHALSDSSVADGGCVESMNIRLENGEVSTMVPPQLFDELPTGLQYDLIYIHVSNNKRVFIGINDSNEIGKVKLKDVGSITGFSRFHTLEEGESLVDITSIGNILIIATTKNMLYFVSKEETYSFLGNNIPKPEVEMQQLDISDLNKDNYGYEVYYFRTYDELNIDYKTETIQGTETPNPYFILMNPNAMPEGSDKFEFGITLDKLTNTTGYWVNENKKSALDVYNECRTVTSKIIWDGYTDIVNNFNKAGILIRPVFVRYALKLYGTEDSYIYQSAPILMGTGTGQAFGLRINTYIMPFAALPAFVYSPFLSYRLFADIKNNEAFNKWKDVIQSIDFFISEPLDIVPYGQEISYMKRTVISDEEPTIYSIAFKDITKEETENYVLNKCSNFYLLKSIPISSLTEDTNRIDFTDDLAVKLGDNLPTNTKLVDGFQNMHKTLPELLYVYNRRLNIASFSQDLFEGWNFLQSFSKSLFMLSQASTTTFVFHIKVDGQTYYRKVEAPKKYMLGFSNGETIIDQKYITYQGPWITYPDTRCEQVDVYTQQFGALLKWTFPMKKHPFLNCSYVFNDYSGSIEMLPSEVVESIPEYNTSQLVFVSNELRQSEVNNPFVFLPENMHAVQSEKIIAMAVATSAMSPGQYGTFPLYLFCSNGIYALDINSQGQYVSSSALPAEVCNNVESITSVINGVVFSTDRGLMMISGAQVVNLSENMMFQNFRYSQIRDLDTLLDKMAAKLSINRDIIKVSDHTFGDYLKSCKVAYDYGNQRLILINPSADYQYIFDFKSGTWHHMSIGKVFKNTVRSYPECLIQEDNAAGDDVYNFNVIYDTASIQTKQPGLIITRGADLDMPEILKRLDRVIARGGINNSSEIRIAVFGSRDGINYIHVPSLKGTSFKSYIFVIMMNTFPKLKLTSLTLQWQERFTNRLR